MASILGTILRAATKKEGQPLNILTFPTHERYESGLAKTGHNFYAYRGPGIKDWDTTYAPLPANYHLLEPEREPPLELDFDLILSQNKFGQFAVAKHFSHAYHCPLVSLEHTLPVPNWTTDTLRKLTAMKGHTNVFISEYSINQWGFKQEEAVVVHHGVDTDMFAPREATKKAHLLSVVNDWPNRDWCCGFTLWRNLSQGLPVHVVGNSPGFSLPAKNTNELVQFYNEAQVFLNTSLVSPVPTVLLEAMACGCAVVSTATCMIPEIITNGVNGFISNDPAELRKHCETLLKQPKLAARLGRAARQTILNRFSMDSFVSSWNNVLQQASNSFVKEAYEG